MKKKSVFKKFIYSRKAAPYVFISPFIITFLVFFAYSIVSMIIMSFQKVAGPNTTFVGFENYNILKNAVFIKSLKNSIFYTIGSCILMIPIPMVLAAMLNSKHMRAKTTFRSILFIPALTSIVVAGVVFRLMFGELDNSFMNQVLSVFGKEPVVWLRKPVTAWTAMFLLCLWRWTGVNMMYYLSGLQQIPGDLYESASIDGATSLQQLRYITIPLLKPTTIYVLTISIFGGMAMFSESYILFNGNKSPNNIGTTLVGFLYRLGLEQNNFGIASAIGVIFLLIVLGINFIQLRLNGTMGKGGDK
ncbi:carbohydrate ABC transporter permease [Murimonas intestini]|uniref:Carbohydrate ABC transporter membrane protein 1 (CUT1 family) n=1 Tax=Murimonas intestini TaxID=1337051 RepID=A0AB73T1B0_9FIRM|nr:sugar ABC transporter permease [Murimonas intestini]MCR1842471.1 sugar ABC transporter permease [Murimonas intestini]MCR1867171.1 sugar ABC transporter permease [Murimonas intestini]MCR1884357.1 sugar ABC transporter permease [Murimonas intestini]